MIYYAYVDKVEIQEENALFEFHCIETGFADNFLFGDRDLFRANIIKDTGQVIALTNTAEAVRRIFNVEADFLDTESVK